MSRDTYGGPRRPGRPGAVHLLTIDEDEYEPHLGYRFRWRCHCGAHGPWRLSRERAETMGAAHVGRSR